MFVRLDNRREYGEDRWIGIGFLGPIAAVVIYTERDDTIRTISARKASKHERKKYENKFSN